MIEQQNIPIPPLPGFDNSTRWVSPAGNIEIWTKPPEGYVTEEEWNRLHPVTQLDLDLRRVSEIPAQLRQIDEQSARAMRALAIDPTSQADEQRLRELEAQAVALRDELAMLNKRIADAS